MDGKEKCKKSMSAKKPPKSPRPHIGFSLDVADEKFIKELAMIKRARTKRTKTLMHKKASSSSTNADRETMIIDGCCLKVNATRAASSDSTDWNRAPSERRSDIWLDVKRRVVIEIAPKSVVEINTTNKEDYVVKQQHGIRKQQAVWR
nr:hypothetical protein CTI12_AA463360 [Tanacetum cinerariifolium]